MNSIEAILLAAYLFFCCLPAYLLTMKPERGCLPILLIIAGFPGALAALIVMGINEIDEKQRRKEGQREREVRQSEQEAEQRRLDQIEEARQARYEANRRAAYSTFLNSSATSDIIEMISKPCPQYRPSEIHVSHKDVSSYFNGSFAAVFDFTTQGVPLLDPYSVFEVNGKEYPASPRDDIRINQPLLLAEAISARMGNIYEVTPIIKWKISHRDSDDGFVIYGEGHQDYVQLRLRATRSF